MDGRSLTRDGAGRVSAAPLGPFETGAQARAAYPTVPVTAAARSQVILDVVEAAGVRLGAYDLRTTRWLAMQSVESVAAIAGIIQRAAAGRAENEIAGES